MPNHYSIKRVFLNDFGVNPVSFLKYFVKLVGSSKPKKWANCALLISELINFRFACSTIKSLIILLAVLCINSLQILFRCL